MQAEEISRKELEDKSQEIVIKTNPEELIYVGYILEAFEGFCYYTTIDKKKTLLKLTATKYYLPKIDKILKFIRKYQI
ncbi:MAG: DUF4911 domain-containing protein [Candidatus Cloacimonetes bacterium]|nr:DUF4911 domain-containing protein [Candidatus Cloacimonadota bacterium]